MDKVATEALLNCLCEQGKSVRDIAKVAAKHSKSLTGRGPYAARFFRATLDLIALEKKLRPALVGLELDAADMTALEDHLEVLRAIDPRGNKTDALRRIELLIHSVILPKLHAMGQVSVPKSEQVLPMDVVRGTRGYLENIIVQANGSYEHGWFDACCVMIRKFVKLLIIEVYEKHHKEAEIQDSGGDFLMLSQLIDRTLAESVWNLNRNTKKALPLIKPLGDRSAHARRYVARKGDVDKIIPGLRDIADEFLHLAGMR
jgi:hypothetical protein